LVILKDFEAATQLDFAPNKINVFDDCIAGRSEMWRSLSVNPNIRVSSRGFGTTCSSLDDAIETRSSEHASSAAAAQLLLRFGVSVLSFGP
jgi:hypothetical protein